jgi:Domain of unknown function (DUF4386)
VIWPIVRRQSETLALGYVASRIVESTVIVVGLISLLSVVTLREDFAGAGANADSLNVAGQSLVAIHDWTFRSLLHSPVAWLAAGFVAGKLVQHSWQAK